MRSELASADMPLGWALTPIESIIPHDGIFSDGDWVESKDQDPNGDVRLIQLADVGDGVFHSRSARFLTSAKARELRCTYLQEGDILIARMPDPLGRACVFPFGADQRFVTVVDVCVVRNDQEQVDRTYLCHVINFLGVRKQVEDLQTGTTRKRISRRNLATVQIPLAPIGEQRRIAAKIDELFSELEAGIESLKKARAKLATYRQAVLKYAFEGKLTAHWREENKDILATPEQLLARINNDRSLCYEKELRDWNNTAKYRDQRRESAKTPTRPRRPTEMGPIDGEQRDYLPAIPAFWEWICLKHVGRIETGTTPSTKNYANYGGTLPFFKPTDLDQGMHVEAAREFLSKRGEQLARVLPPGSTLVTCIGATIGKTGLSVQRCATNQQINSIIPDRGFEPRLVYYQVSSPFLKGRIKSGASATTLPILNKSKFGELPFALCSLAEQRELVRLVEERIADIERSERYVIVALRQANALRQSILKIAFSGQLVPRNPNDEPASVLLDRIRAERELLTQRPRHRKTGKRMKAKVTA